MKKRLALNILSIIAIVILLFATFIYFFNRKNGITVNFANTYFILKSGASLEESANALKDKSIIRSKKAFFYYARFYKLHPPLKSGNFIISPKTSMKDLILKLESGQSDFAIITIPEGYTLHRIATIIDKNNLSKKEYILNSKIKDLKENDLISENTNVAYELEGYLFPDTYYIPYASDKSTIIELMYNRFSSIFSEKYRLRTKELGLNVNQVVTIASLIEKEAANDEERSRIAGVIYNRLKKRMPLQIDAAVIYANTLGEKSLNPVTKAHLKKDSKYNTYLYKGIPPGPIASPGKPSIEAALFPENHEYLYYVAGPSGHVFSKTYEEHLRNIKEYLK